MSDNNTLQQDLGSLTDQCVMCGVCLPHCPTYSMAKNEAESPRGRISLIRALHKEKIQSSSSTLVQHLDNCLACMNCHTICPANVNYPKILDAGREITRDRHTLRHKLIQSLLFAILTAPRVRHVVKKALGIYHRLGIDRLLTKLPVYGKRPFRLIPRPLDLPTPKYFTESKNSPKYLHANQDVRVILSNSCAGDLFSDAVGTAAVRLLKALHCEIREKNHCCGALHQHGGYSKAATKLMRDFCRAHTNERFDVLVSTATGCAAQLNRYPELLGDTTASILAERHVNINDFVLQQIKRHKPKFKPLPVRIFIHKPCTQKLVTDNPQVTEQLLSKIPGVQLSFFQSETTCCGAGGTNFLMQAQLAERLIRDKISELRRGDVEYLVTSNIGCAVHFQAQLRNIDASVRICHPITLLAQQLLYC